MHMSNMLSAHAQSLFYCCFFAGRSRNLQAEGSQRATEGSCKRHEKKGYRIITGGCNDGRNTEWLQRRRFHRQGWGRRADRGIDRGGGRSVPV